MRRVEVLFTFETAQPVRMQYRGVRGIRGEFRMETKGPEAKHFRPIVWTWEMGLVEYYLMLVRYYGISGVTPQWIEDRHPWNTLGVL